MKKRIFTLLLAFVMVTMMFVACGRDSDSDVEALNWEELVLGDKLPEAPGTKAEIIQNTKQKLWIEIHDITAKQYADYIESCKIFGYTIEVTEEYSNFQAFNTAGYKLKMIHNDFGDEKKLSIVLDEPKELETIAWPVGAAGQQLPVPESTIGLISYENDDSFYLYIGETDHEAYEAYVNACIEKGFDVDYSKYDNYFSADNAEGWSLSVTYEGNGVMSISIKKSDDADSNTETTEVTEESTEVTTEALTEATESNGLRPGFKDAMDSYEKFMDEYIAFMKKYENNPNDWSVLTEYADFMQKYAEFCEDFEKWGEEDMNAAETAYYIEVQTRVNKKLLEAAA